MLTFVDIITDIIVIVQWKSNGHRYWFSIGLSITLLSDIIEGNFFYDREGLFSGVLHLMGFGAPYEYIRWWRSGCSFEDDEQFAFSLTKVFETCFEGAPFIFLQGYVFFLEESYTYESIASIVVTLLSLGYTAFLMNTDNKLASGHLIEQKEMYLILIPLFVLDSIVRTVTLALFLNAFPSTIVRFSCAVAFFVAYLLLVQVKGKRLSYLIKFVIVLTYPVVNINYDDCEMLCRHFLSIMILIILRYKEVIGMVVFYLGLLFSICLASISSLRTCGSNRPLESKSQKAETLFKIGSLNL